MSSQPDSKRQKKAAPRIKLNKSNVDSLKEPGIYQDTDLPGFQLRIGSSGVKTYRAVAKPKGSAKPVYVTLGRHGKTTADRARADAKEHLHTLSQGGNPNKLLEEKHRVEAEKAEAEVAKQKMKGLTIRDGFAKHIELGQRESTIKSYQKVINAHLKDWLAKPLIEVRQSDIKELYKTIEAKSPSSAAHAMRLLKAVFKTARREYGEDFPELANHDPTIALGGITGWNTLEPKQDYIQDGDLPAFYSAVMKLESQTAKDYLMVCILAGLRLGEACSLQWERDGVEDAGVNYVSLSKTKGVITICSEGAKNKQRHRLAMSDYLHALFLRRRQGRESIYVFPGKSKTGAYARPHTAIDEVVNNAEIPQFSSHSLRRTFATAADAEGYDLRSIQRLLNHTSGNVTDKHYIQKHAEKTREPMQRITDRLLKLMRAEVSADELTSNVIPLTVKTVTG